MTLCRLLSFACAAAIGVWGSTAQAQALDTRATAAWVYDLTTGTVLLDKNANVPLPPASMSKLMTLYMAFEAISDSRLTIDETLSVSQHCMDYDGSSMFLNTTDRVRVEDLLRGVIILSGNDAACVLAEALSPDGTEGGFARMMTDRAARLGMTNSRFANSNGWPAEGQRMSMHDLGWLATHIITDYPTYYPIFSEQEFAFDGRVPSNTQNRNPILGLGIGADGLKTGHTEEAGYGLVGSAKQGDRRIVFVVTGLDSPQARAEEGQKIINWAFRQFAQKAVATAGTRIAEAPVWLGDSATVGLTVAQDLALLVPVMDQDAIPAQVVYDSPIEAPITAGQKLGELVITLPGLPETRLPLVADRDVARGGFAIRVRTAASILMGKIMPASAPAPAPSSDGTS